MEREGEVGETSDFVFHLSVPDGHERGSTGGWLGHPSSAV
jgi:hypothetical protein